MGRHWKPVIVLIALSIAFFFPSLIRGQGFFYGDNLSQRIPQLTFWKQEVTNGRLPLWNPFILAGIPFFADLSNNVLSPTNIAYLFLPVPLALTMLVLLYVSLAGIGTYFYVYAITGKRLSGIFAGIAFAFSGTLIASVNDVNSLQGIALIPLVFAASHRWAVKPDARKAIGLIAVLALQFFSSHPQYSYYTWIAVGAYLFYMQKRPQTARIISIAKIFIATLGVIAVQLFPFFELSREAYRPQTQEFSATNQLQLIELPRLFLANFYGSWRAGTSWGPGSQLETGLGNTEGYSGIIPLIFAAIALLRGKSKPTRFWIALAAFSFLLSLGDQTPLFWLMRKTLPFFTKFRSPIRALSFTGFAIAVLAGIGLEGKQRRGSAGTSH